MKLPFRTDWRARKLALVIIAISTVAIIGSLVTNVYLEPERLALKELQFIARDYYENYFYQNYLNEHTYEDGLDIEEAFSAYTAKGFPAVRLRQLLLYDGGKYAASRAYFEAERFTCDENLTSVTYVPYAPFGRTDYTVSYDTTSCLKR